MAQYGAHRVVLVDDTINDVRGAWVGKTASGLGMVFISSTDRGRSDTESVLGTAAQVDHVTRNYLA